MMTGAASRAATARSALSHPVAVAQAATGLASLDPAADAAMGLRRQVLQEERVHRALEADVKLADLAFGERDQSDADELEMLVECRDIGLIAADPVERLGEDDVEATGLCIL